MTYRACKSIIERKFYESVEDMRMKLDIFLLNNRVTQSEYEELTGILNSH